MAQSSRRSATEPIRTQHLKVWLALNLRQRLMKFLGSPLRHAPTFRETSAGLRGFSSKKRSLFAHRISMQNPTWKRSRREHRALRVPFGEERWMDVRTGFGTAEISSSQSLDHLTGFAPPWRQVFPLGPTVSSLCPKDAGQVTIFRSERHSCYRAALTYIRTRSDGSLRRGA